MAILRSGFASQLCLKTRQPSAPVGFDNQSWYSVSGSAFKYEALVKGFSGSLFGCQQPLNQGSLLVRIRAHALGWRKLHGQSLAPTLKLSKVKRLTAACRSPWELLLRWREIKLAPQPMDQERELQVILSLPKTCRRRRSFKANSRTVISPALNTGHDLQQMLATLKRVRGKSKAQACFFSWRSAISCCRRCRSLGGTQTDVPHICSCWLLKLDPVTFQTFCNYCCALSTKSAFQLSRPFTSA